jgi:hypothetical protein
MWLTQLQCNYTNTGTTLKVTQNSVFSRLDADCLIQPSQVSYPLDTSVMPIYILTLYARPLCPSIMPIHFAYPLYPSIMPMYILLTSTICPIPVYSFLPIYSRFTHSSTSNCKVFVSINCFRVFKGFDFVIEFTGFKFPLIHLTSIIS